MRILALALAVLMLPASTSDAQDGRRIALVIGNAGYQIPAWRLANPVHDAELMAERLMALGFDVDLVRDAGKNDMDAAFQRFGSRLVAAGPSAVAVVFYAGHGAESDGANYLIPVDADIRTKDELRYEAPPAQFLLDYMAAAGNAVNFLILDACRDMPLPDGQRSLGRGGLAELPDKPNVLIAYATAPNRTAPDGVDANNSPFTAALAEALATQAGDPVSLLFADVQARVHQQSGGKQRPRFTNGLGVARWSFAAPKPPPATGEDARVAALKALLAPVSLAGSAPPSELEQEFAQAAPTRVFFDFDEVVVRAEAQAALDQQAKWLLARPNVRVRVYGNADKRESDPIALGAQRAKAVRDYLLGCGVPPERVGSTSYGVDMPLTPQVDEVAWAMARNVETRLVSVAE